MANVVEITDFSAKELDIYARCTEVQLLNREDPVEGNFYRREPEGHCACAGCRCLPVSILAETGQLQGEGADILRRCPQTPVYAADHAVISKLTGFPMTRGMLCAMRRPVPKSPEELCRSARRIAVLENIVNPTNVGAIFRSAAALSMDAVLLSTGCSNPLLPSGDPREHGDGFSDSVGFFEHGAWPGRGMEILHEHGFCTAAMALKEDSVGIDDPDLAKEEKLAIVLGTEGDGLADGTIADCDYTVRIPMSHGVDSLNVASASAVAFWELGRRRGDR